MATTKMRFGYNFWTFVIVFNLVYWSATGVLADSNDKSKPLEIRKAVFAETRKLVNHAEIAKQNRGGLVDTVIYRTGLNTYEQRPYCAATVWFCTTKAGVKLKVDNKFAARAYFRGDAPIIWFNGRYVGITKEEPQLMDLCGFSFYGNAITHIGLYVKGLSPQDAEVFEGNTTNPNNRNQEGFYDKRRSINRMVIRKLL